MSSARDVTVSKSAIPDGAAEQATLALLNAKVVPDGITNALRTIDYGHHEIHSGRTYRVQGYTASATNLIVAFKVGDQARQPHMVFEWVAEAKGSLSVYEGRTWTTNTGTRRSVKQSNRNSANTSILEGDGNGAGGFVANEVVIDPTGQAAGTLISMKAWFAAKNAGGDSGSRRAEIVLKPNTTYSFEMAPTGVASGMQVRLEWYEHTPGSYT